MLQDVRSVTEASLFVPSGPSLSPAIGWLETTLLGPLAIGVSVVAVALVGFAMLSGRIAIPLAGRTLLGVAILLSAPLIAAAFVQEGDGRSVATNPPVVASSQSSRELEPVDADPNPGASLRRD